MACRINGNRPDAICSKMFSLESATVVFPRPVASTKSTLLIMVKWFAQLSEEACDQYRDI